LKKRETWPKNRRSEPGKLTGDGGKEITLSRQVVRKLNENNGEGRCRKLQ